MSEYTEKAEKFLIDTNTTIHTKFLYHGPYFTDDKDTRDVYEVCIERKGVMHPYRFKFGQSIAHSGTADIHVRRRSPPTAYAVLACLTKYDPDTFANFCLEFDYDEDSRKAEKTYFAVQEEWSNVRRIFNDVLEKLREIN